MVLSTWIKRYREEVGTSVLVFPGCCLKVQWGKIREIFETSEKSPKSLQNISSTILRNCWSTTGGPKTLWVFYYS